MIWKYFLLFSLILVNIAAAGRYTDNSLDSECGAPDSLLSASSDEFRDNFIKKRIYYYCCSKVISLGIAARCTLIIQLGSTTK